VLESLRHCTEIILAYHPPSFLAPVSHVKFAVIVMAPHAFEAGPVQIENTCGTFEEMKIIAIQAPYFVVSGLISWISAIEIPDNVWISFDAQI